MIVTTSGLTRLIADNQHMLSNVGYHPDSSVKYSKGNKLHLSLAISPTDILIFSFLFQCRLLHVLNDFRVNFSVNTANFYGFKNNGEIIFKIFDRKNGVNFIGFLQLLLKIYPILEIYLVVDRATYHRSGMVKEWLAKNLKIHLIYLPPKSPRLNPIERIWRWLKEEVAANRTYNDIEPLKHECVETLSSLTYEDALRISGLKSC